MSEAIVEIKIVVVALFIAALAILGYTTKYYYDQYEASLQKTASLQTSLNQAIAAGKVCSDNTTKLQQETQVKAAQIAAAQAKADQEAKQNKSLAEQLLHSVPINSKDMCQSAVSLFQGYKKNLSAPAVATEH